MQRPVGGVLMGYVADTFSTKRALELSIFCMAFPTFALGCLPTFETAGWWSLILLVLVRLLQGLSVGGQLMSSLVFVVEGHERKYWGWYGSFAMTSASIGTLFGNIVGVRGSGL
jgi:MHS family proline/betaine transporter-like MFS transporter